MAGSKCAVGVRHVDITRLLDETCFVLDNGPGEYGGDAYYITRIFDHFLSRTFALKRCSLRTMIDDLLMWAGLFRTRGEATARSLPRRRLRSRGARPTLYCVALCQNDF